MLAEHLPVIAGDDDQRRVVQAQLLQTLDHAPDAVVGVGDLARVGIAGEPRRKGLRRRVVGVRVVVVQEQEEPLVRVLLQPLQCEAARLLPPALTDGQLLVRILEAVFVVLEALVESGLGIQDEGADDGARREAAPAENLGQRFARVPQLVVEVVADAVTGRNGAGQHRAVSRQRHRNGGVGVPEDDAFPGDPVDVRGGAAGMAVAAEVVGPAGVDADQQDVADRGRGRGLAGEENPARPDGGRQEQGPEKSSASGSGPAPGALVSHDSQSGISA